MRLLFHYAPPLGGTGPDIPSSALGQTRQIDEQCTFTIIFTIITGSVRGLFF